MTGTGSTGEELAQGGCHVAVAADRPEPATAEAGQVAGQVRILLAGGVEQDLQPGQARGERPRIGAGVVHAVRQQQDPRTSSPASAPTVAAAVLTRSPRMEPDTSTSSTTERRVRTCSRTTMSSSLGTGCSASASSVRSRSMSSEPPR
jgi:hypothetical protein